MPLSQRQLEALDAIDWLLDPGMAYRQTGRSLLFAVGLVRAAARNPGVWVYLTDHSMSVGVTQAQAQRFLESTVRDLVVSDLNLRPHFEMNRSRFRLNLEYNVDSWQPPEAFFAENRMYLREAGEVRQRIQPFLEQGIRGFQGVQSLPPPPPPERLTVWELLMADD